MRWLKNQPVAVTQSDEDLDLGFDYESLGVCRCDENEADALPRDPQARETWATALRRLELTLPRDSFNSWLKGTEGVGYQDGDLLVAVPSVLTVAWIEQRLYQDVLRSLRETVGALLDVQFTVRPAGHCRIHS